MEPSTKLFERVALKLGWDKPGAIDRAEEESLKSRRLAVLDSSDDEFNQILSDKATTRSACRQISSAKKMREPVSLLSSSDSDDSFENFLSRVKTPKAQPRPQSVNGSDDSSLKHFIVDDLSSDDDFEVDKKQQPSISKGKQKTPKSLPRLEKQSILPEYDPPVFLSDTDDDSDLVIRSTWGTRHSRPASQPSSRERDKPVKDHTPHFPSSLVSVHTPVPSSAPPTHNRQCEDTASSEDEFQSLLDRIKKNQKLGSSRTHTPLKPSTEPKASSGSPAVRGRKESDHVQVKAPLVDRTPACATFNRPVSQTEPRPGPTSRVAVCKTPGCFLLSLGVPDSTYCRNFKHKKEELTSKLYQLYNSSVFENKLPSDMSVTWNTKLRKTAGYCITGQERITGKRYARIELSVKVCDSADRLRDTLVHEMCHAATWLINNVRDGHGPFWKIYARKATLAHPELPMVTRCHSYDINYKYQYQCTRCKNTIGRHSKSLDTQRFVCALCTGQLVLLTPSNSRGPTPFATFVKENYGAARQELAGQSHAEVMRKLSADFASKTRLSQS